MSYNGDSMETPAQITDMAEQYKAAMDYSMSIVGRFSERVMVFLDGGYVHICIRDQFENKPLSITKFATKLAAGKRLRRIYYYTGRIENPPNEDWKRRHIGQQKLLAALAHEEFVEVRLGRLRIEHNGSAQQKGVDVLLALDMLRFALKDNYDTAILISGDGDFADIVKMVKDEGKKVELVTFPGTRARALLSASDTHIEVTTELLEGCWLEKDEDSVPQQK